MITLLPYEEAEIIKYICFYQTCGKVCRNRIRKIILKYGKRMNRIVYRGQSSKSSSISSLTPFFSVSPRKRMALLFTEIDWEKMERIGYIFKIHLINTFGLSTRNINYTLSDEVIEYLDNSIGDVKIEKGEMNLTKARNFFNNLNEMIKSLVFESDEEILILGDGTFYKDEDLREEGFNPIREREFETWYG